MSIDVLEEIDWDQRLEDDLESRGLTEEQWRSMRR